jgi:pyruvate kinase
MNRQRRVKIICTLGPASSDLDTIRKLAKAGMNVARLNFSHGEHASHRDLFLNVRKVAKELGQPIAILMDLQGPKIRVRRFKDNQAKLKKGQPFVLTTREILGDDTCASVSFRELPQTVSVGEEILLDDGLLAMKVEKIDGEDVHCTVLRAGSLRNRKGINLPGSKVAIDSLTAKDRRDLDFAMEIGADYLALSFVQHPKDIVEIKEIIRAAGKDIPIIAKIEKPQAVENIKEIIAATDVIMLARGDLGVEMAVEEVPPIQKKVIKLCNAAGVPVITATQMLESMVHTPRPTRAEASDVANAVLDGTDAVMLSAETAVGEYPFHTVETMGRIISLIELQYEHIWHQRRSSDREEDAPLAHAIAFAACQAAEMVNAEAVVTFTIMGLMPLRVARVRPRSQIIGVTSRESTYHQLALLWGVRSFLVNELHGDVAEAAQSILIQLRDADYLKAGQQAVITAGVPFESQRPTNMCLVEQVPAKS